MTNPVHLVVVPEKENSLARTFGRTHAEYVQALTHSERRTGHLWQNRFFSCPLDAAHRENAMRYVELNPVRAGFTGMPWAVVEHTGAQSGGSKGSGVGLQLRRTLGKLGLLRLERESTVGRI
jgi:putative transposase